jgi:hypothetical protein
MTGLGTGDWDNIHRNWDREWVTIDNLLRGLRGMA